jgi:hypothetical protein
MSDDTKRLDDYRTGFIDGAAFRAMQFVSEDYDAGYSDGRRAFQQAMAAYREKLGMPPAALIHPAMAAARPQRETKGKA